MSLNSTYFPCPPNFLLTSLSTSPDLLVALSTERCLPLSTSTDPTLDVSRIGVDGVSCGGTCAASEYAMGCNVPFCSTKHVDSEFGVAVDARDVLQM